MRIKLLNRTQKSFLDECIFLLKSPSLINLLDYGISTTYSSLKNYYSNRRLMPKDLFEELIHITKIDKEIIKYEELNESWGKSKGGKTSKRVAQN